jgi:hypothetical protein
MSDIHASVTTPSEGYGEWLTDVDCQVKGEHDTPTIYLLLCKSENNIVAEYVLGKTQSMGTKLPRNLPTKSQSSMPSIEHTLAGDGTLMEDESQ